MSKIVVDAKKCISAGDCARVAGEVFRQNPDDGLVVLIQESPPEELMPKARRAAKLCPAVAIRIEESKS